MALRNTIGALFGALALGAVLAAVLAVSGCDIDSAYEGAAVSSNAEDPNAIVTTRIVGSVGDGPIENARVRVFTNSGEELSETRSSNTADYEITVRTQGRNYPLTIVADEGTDMVTRKPPDFSLASVVMSPGRNEIANLNPFGTLIVRTAEKSGGISYETIAAATDAVVERYGFGLGSSLVAHPIFSPMDDTNVHVVVKASETLGEMIRRTRDALMAVNFEVEGVDGEPRVIDGDGVVQALAADLVDGWVDGRGAEGHDRRIAAVANVASAPVMLEALTNRLRIDFYNLDAEIAKAQMDSVIGIVRPESTLRTGDVTIPPEALMQARRALHAAMLVTSDEYVLEAIYAVQTTAPGSTQMNPLQSEYDKALGSAIEALNRAILDTAADWITDEGLLDEINSSDEVPYLENPSEPTPDSHDVPDEIVKDEEIVKAPEEEAAEKEELAAPPVSSGPTEEENQDNDSGAIDEEPIVQDEPINDDPNGAPIIFGAEYFVAPHGSDGASGGSVEKAFATVAKGVSVLKAGDTLTLLPGHYFEAVAVRLQGERDAPITIRAQRPGTALLRGDRDVSGFQQAEGTRYTYWIDLDRRAEGVADRNHLRLYEPVFSVEQVDRTPGSFYQHAETGRVYVHSADSRHPDGNALTVSVTNGFGLHLLPSSRDVLIDGLAFTGYNSRDYPEGPGSRNRWGLFVDTFSERVVIRRSVAYLNSGGIFMSAPSEGVVEDSRAFANHSRFQPLGNNILAWSPHNTAFRRNVVEQFWQPGTDQSLTFYGGARHDGKVLGGWMQDNLAVNTGIMIKGEFSEQATFQTGNQVVAGTYYRSPDASNLRLGDNTTPEALRHYVDPIAHDYRLQSDSPLRGTGPNGQDPGPHPYRGEVFFVSPAGNDGNAGTSVAQAWRTLAHAARSARPGQTVYVLEGVYRESLVPVHSGEAGRPVEFLRRGRDRVVLDGEGRNVPGIDLAGTSHVRVRGFVVRNFGGAGVRADGGHGVRVEEVIAENSGGAGVLATGATGFALRRSLLVGNAGGGLRLERSPGAESVGNAFFGNPGAALALDTASLAGLHSDANAFTPTGSGRLAEVAGDAHATLDAWRGASGQDRNSLQAEPGFADAANGDFSLGPGSPLVGRGPKALPIGPYLRVPVDAPAVVKHLETRTVGATSATVEWWTPGAEVTTTLEWGETQAFGHRVTTSAGTLHSVGLAGLTPGREHHVRVSVRQTTKAHRWVPHRLPEGTAPAEATTETATFRTLATDAPGRTFHVSVLGDDGNSGLSADEAWRTLSHAAARLRAGDTVLVHEGTYEEPVLVRASGDRHAPVTFRAAPGATVWLQGRHNIATAFRIENKHHVHLDGFRFRHFRDIPHGGGAVSIQGGSGHALRRCFYDGRERQAYVGPLFRATDTDGLLVENCVMIGGMGTGGYLLGNSHRAVLRHNVFYNQLVYAMEMMVGPHFVQADFDLEAVPRFDFSHNLVIDMQPTKDNPLFRVWHVDSMRSDHNGYFMRKGADERRILQARYFQGEAIGPLAPEEFRLSSHQGQIVWQLFLLQHLRDQAGLERHSVFGNPGIRVVAELVPQGPLLTAAYWRDELHWDGQRFQPLDFQDFFVDPAGPFGRSAAGKPIGLDPAAFQ